MVNSMVKDGRGQHPAICVLERGQAIARAVRGPGPSSGGVNADAAGLSSPAAEGRKLTRVVLDVAGRAAAMQPDGSGELVGSAPLAGIHQKAPDARERMLGCGCTQTGLSIGCGVCSVVEMCGRHGFMSLVEAQ